MTDKSKAILVDPPDVRVGRVEGWQFEDGHDRIMVTWEHPDMDVSVVLKPDTFGSFVIFVLKALGLPESDLEYIAERLLKEAQ